MEKEEVKRKVSIAPADGQHLKHVGYFLHVDFLLKLKVLFSAHNALSHFIHTISTIDSDKFHLYAHSVDHLPGDQMGSNNITRNSCTPSSKFVVDKGFPGDESADISH